MARAQQMSSSLHGECWVGGGGGWGGGRLVPSQLANSLRLHKGIVTMASTGQSKICIFWQEFFSLDILYLEGKSPLLMRNKQVRFGDMLPETSKSSAFWDMGVNSHLKWLLLFSPCEVGEWGRPQSSWGGRRRLYAIS